MINDKKTSEFSAKTVEEAIKLGLDNFNASIGDVDIEILEEGSKGIFGIFGAKNAKISIKYKKDSEEGKSVLDSFSKTLQTIHQPTKQSKAVAKSNKVNDNVSAKEIVEPRAKTEAKPFLKEIVNKSTMDSTQIAEVEKKALDFLTTITKMMDVEVQIDVKLNDNGNLNVSMTGDTLGILIGRRGETLDALQYITSLVINKGCDEYTRVLLDSENYRSKREEALRRLAQRMANRAIKTGRKVVMEPMNPYERRILHSALQSNSNVSTHSEGEEPNRHLVITVK